MKSLTPYHTDHLSLLAETEFHSISMFSCLSFFQMNMAR